MRVAPLIEDARSPPKGMTYHSVTALPSEQMVEEQLSVISKKCRQGGYSYPDNEMRNFLWSNPSSLLRLAPVNEASHYLEINFGDRTGLTNEMVFKADNYRENVDSQKPRGSCPACFAMPRQWRLSPIFLKPRRRQPSLPLAAQVV